MATIAIHSRPLISTRALLGTTTPEEVSFRDRFVAVLMRAFGAFAV